MSYQTEGQWSRKRGQLEKPHVLPLTQYVRRLRHEHGPDDVPDFDPEDGGTSARILLLLTSPSRHALPSTGSGFVSIENHDSTAQAVKQAVHSASVGRASLAVWNLVPRRTVSERPTAGEVAAGVRELAELIKLLPRVEVVIATGNLARLAANRLQTVIGGRQLMVCGSPIQRGKPKANTIAALADAMNQARARLG